MKKKSRFVTMDYVKKNYVHRDNYFVLWMNLILGFFLATIWMSLNNSFVGWYWYFAVTILTIMSLVDVVCFIVALCGGFG